MIRALCVLSAAWLCTTIASAQPTAGAASPPPVPAAPSGTPAPRPPAAAPSGTPAPRSAPAAVSGTPGAAVGDARSACGAFEFSTEVIFGDTTTNLCPKPVDTALELMRAKLERTQIKDTKLFFDVLRELRDHYQAPATVTDPHSWRAGLAQHIDKVFVEAKDKRVPAFFAAVRGPNDIDPPACLFLTGDAGDTAHACYLLKGTPKPTGQPGMSTYEVSDFSDAYLAHKALAIAFSALVKLDLPALDDAIKRLALANQRWDSLRKRGYLQYPWELAFSGVFAAYQDYQACFASDKYCTGEQGLDPERMRLIALHPGVGMGFSGFGKNPKPSADATLALSLELVGLTYYQADFSSYFGASLGAVVNDGDFGDVRPGVFLHLTRWLHVGYLMSFFQRDTRYDATLFLSTDLGSAFGINFLN